MKQHLDDNYHSYQDLLIHKDGNLNLVTTRQCNAKCAFCYDHVTFAGEGEYVSPEDIKLKVILRLCEVIGIQRVVFTGGEPTVNPQKLYQLITATALQFGIKRKLYSNGFRLFAGINGKPLIEKLAGKYINALNISRAHYDADTNRAIMRAQKVSTKDEIKRVADMQDDNRFKLMLSAYLTKEGIITAEDIYEYIKFGESCGVRSFTFHAGGFVPEKFRKDTPESHLHHEINDCIDIDILVFELMERFGFKKYMDGEKDSHNERKHLHQLTNGISVIKIRQCTKKDEGKDRRIHRIVFGPDRIPRSSWIDPERLITI